MPKLSVTGLALLASANFLTVGAQSTTGGFATVTYSQSQGQPSATVAAPGTASWTSLDPAPTGEPCAQVSAYSAAFASANPSATPVLVPPEVALDCLRSVPVDTDGDQTLIQELQAYFQFQSTLAYLKNPPANYTEPPVDIMGGLTSIASNLTNNGYNNEYDLQHDIATLVTSAQDNHFAYQADIINVVFFTRSTGLVSVSLDGTSLPQVYLLSDIMNYSQGDSPSAITQINGQNVTEYLLDYAVVVADYHDADTRFNALFTNSLAASNGNDNPVFETSFLYQGNYTNLQFQNGSSMQIQNSASLNSNLPSWNGVTDGKSFFQNFCTGQAASGSSSGSGTMTKPIRHQDVVRFEEDAAAAAPMTSATGLPMPVVLASDASIGGYYSTDEGFGDLAILTIQTFEPASMVEFQSVTSQFLAQATKDGKQKLLIDVRTNGGGNIVLGYDTFKQLFPQYEPYGAGRFRQHPAFQSVLFATDLTFGNLSLAQLNPASPLNSYAEFNYAEMLTVNDTDFPNAAAFAGPHVFNNDNFTTPARQNNSDLVLTQDFAISGYLNASNLPPQPFKAENILILSDGQCTSTCTIFSEFMKMQGNVQTITVGGLPRNGPSQGMGGSKGSQVYSFTLINQGAQAVYGAFQQYDPSEINGFNSTPIGFLSTANQALLRASASSDGLFASVNFRDNLRPPSDTDQLPLEFVYEASDCRIFYTPAMIQNITNTWEAAYTAHWGNGSCIQGSTGAPSSLSGGYPYTFNSNPLPASNSSGGSGGGKKNDAPSNLSMHVVSMSVLAAAISLTFGML